MTGSKIRSRPPSVGGFDDFGFELKAIGMLEERSPHDHVEPALPPAHDKRHSERHSRQPSMLPVPILAPPTPKVPRLAKLGQRIRMGLRFIDIARSPGPRTAPLSKTASAPAFAGFWDLKPQSAPTRRKLNQFIFEEARDISVVVDGDEVVTEYKDQADVNMYTTAALQVREKFRHDKRIDRIARAFWAAFAPNFAESRDDQRILTKQVYVDYFMRLLKALYPADAVPNIESARQLAFEDWKRDAKNESRLNFHDFKTSLYEVVDIWTPTLNIEDYVLFMKTLFCRMMYKVQKAVHAPTNLRNRTLLSGSQSASVKFQFKAYSQVSSSCQFIDFFPDEIRRSSSLETNSQSGSGAETSGTSKNARASVSRKTLLTRNDRQQALYAPRSSSISNQVKQTQEQLQNQTFRMDGADNPSSNASNRYGAKRPSLTPDFGAAKVSSSVPPSLMENIFNQPSSMPSHLEEAVTLRDMSLTQKVQFISLKDKQMSPKRHSLKSKSKTSRRQKARSNDKNFDGNSQLLNGWSEQLLSEPGLFADDLLHGFVAPQFAEEESDFRRVFAHGAFDSSLGEVSHQHSRTPITPSTPRQITNDAAPISVSVDNGKFLPTTSSTPKQSSNDAVSTEPEVIGIMTEKDLFSGGASIQDGTSSDPVSINDIPAAEMLFNIAAVELSNPASNPLSDYRNSNCDIGSKADESVACSASELNEPINNIAAKLDEPISSFALELEKLPSSSNATPAQSLSTACHGGIISLSDKSASVSATAFEGSFLSKSDPLSVDATHKKSLLDSIAVMVAPESPSATRSETSNAVGLPETILMDSPDFVVAVADNEPSASNSVISNNEVQDAVTTVIAVDKDENYRQLNTTMKISDSINNNEAHGAATAAVAIGIGDKGIQQNTDMEISNGYIPFCASSDSKWESSLITAFTGDMLDHSSKDQHDIQNPADSVSLNPITSAIAGASVRVKSRPLSASYAIQLPQKPPRMVRRRANSARRTRGCDSYLKAIVEGSEQPVDLLEKSGEANTADADLEVVCMPPHVQDSLSQKPSLRDFKKASSSCESIRNTSDIRSKSLQTQTNSSNVSLTSNISKYHDFGGSSEQLLPESLLNDDNDDNQEGTNYLRPDSDEIDSRALEVAFQDLSRNSSSNVIRESERLNIMRESERSNPEPLKLDFSSLVTPHSGDNLTERRSFRLHQSREALRQSRFKRVLYQPLKRKEDRNFVVIKPLTNATSPIVAARSAASPEAPTLSPKDADTAEDGQTKPAVSSSSIQRRRHRLMPQVIITPRAPFLLNSEDIVIERHISDSLHPSPITRITILPIQQEEPEQNVMETPKFTLGDLPMLTILKLTTASRLMDSPTTSLEIGNTALGNDSAGGETVRISDQEHCEMRRFSVKEGNLENCLQTLGMTQKTASRCEGGTIYVPMKKETPLLITSSEPKVSARDNSHHGQVLRRALGKGTHICRPLSARSHNHKHRQPCDRRIGRSPESLTTQPGSSASLAYHDIGCEPCRIRTLPSKRPTSAKPELCT